MVVKDETVGKGRIDLETVEVVLKVGGVRDEAGFKVVDVDVDVGKIGVGGVGRDGFGEVDDGLGEVLPGEATG